MLHDSNVLEPSSSEANGITALTITSAACTGVDKTASLTISAPNSYGGRQATGTYTIVSHVIVAVVLTDGGTGYTSLPTVTTGGDGGTITPTWVDGNYRGEWHLTSNYAFSTNAIVSYTTNHRMYKALQNMAIAYTPGAAGNELFWLDWGATEKWAVFDGAVGSQAERADLITYEIDPGIVDSVALLNIEANSVTVAMTDVGGAGAPVVWTQSTLVDDLFVTDVVDMSFPLTYLTPHLVIEIEYTGGTAKIGEIVVGQKKDLGDTHYNPSVSIIDYSIKEVDSFGNYTVLERAYSKRLTCSTTIPKTSLDATYNTLALHRAKAAVWVGSADYPSMIVYGFYKDFSITIPFPSYSLCSLEIEGLV
jgi:hypothetical protein